MPSMNKTRTLQHLSPDFLSAQSLLVCYEQEKAQESVWGYFLQN